MPCAPAIKDVNETCLHAEAALNELLDHLLRLRPELNPLRPSPTTTTKTNVSACSSRSSSFDGNDGQLPAVDQQAATQLAAIQLLALLRLQNFQLATHVRWLLQAGQHYDHAGQQANGFYSWARMVAWLQKHAYKRLEKLRNKQRLSAFAKHVQMLYELSILFDYQLHVLRRLSSAYGQNFQLNASTQSLHNAVNNDECNKENIASTLNLDDEIKLTPSDHMLPVVGAETSPLAHQTFNTRSSTLGLPLQFCCRPDLSEDGTSEQLFLEPMRAYIECNTFTIQPRAQVALSLLYGKHGLYWYNRSTDTVFKMLRAMFLVRGARRTPVQVLNTRKCGATLAANCAQATLRFMTDAFQFTELKAYNRLYISLLKLPSCLQYQARTVQLHAQTELLVPEAGDCVKRLTDPVNCRKIRCRLLRGKTQQQPPSLSKHTPSSAHPDGKQSSLQDTLVFHVHGGGFTITPPDAHEVSEKSSFLCLSLRGSRFISATVVQIRGSFRFFGHSDFTFLPIIGGKRESRQTFWFHQVGSWSAGRPWFTLRSLCISRTNFMFVDFVSLKMFFVTFDLRLVRRPFSLPFLNWCQPTNLFLSLSFCSPFAFNDTTEYKINDCPTECVCVCVRVSRQKRVCVCVFVSHLMLF